MTSPAAAHRAEHSLTVDAPPPLLYGLVSDVTLWPAVFGPSVYVRHLARGAGWERFQIWAVVNGEVRDWTSRRRLDPGRYSITFRQEHSRPPITSMGGQWSFRALPDGRTEIVLAHEFDTDGTPDAVRWIKEALDRNSAEELSALARVASLGRRVEDVVFSFSDTAAIPGGATEAYDFLHRADLWADRLPHVEHVLLTEGPDRVQLLEMGTRTADGTTHETRSIRVCEPRSWIAYKQLLPPALLLGHSGVWTVQDGPGGASITSRHTVVLSPEGVSAALGAGTTLAQAREHVRSALGRNSRTTMELAAAHARSAA
ncbi:aromatase/cyclase [Nonomuraea sp. NPDC046802]|uniref:aromatase/cyclase n=1 Tax=Nonomuraea sp. NPDC046802 TaxID=3154919 RepID=UPI0033C8120D